MKKIKDIFIIAVFFIAVYGMMFYSVMNMDKVSTTISYMEERGER